MTTAFEDFQFEELDPGYPGIADLSITQHYLAFSTSALETMGYPSHVKMMVDASKRIFAVQACTKNDKKAFSFSRPAEEQTRKKQCFQVKLQNTVQALVGEQWEKGFYYCANGTYYADQRTMVFDLNEVMKRKVFSMKREKE